MDGNQLKNFAKKLLRKQEYLRFKTALHVKSFEENGRVLDFCIDLLEMVNAPEKTEILVEARKMLPKSKQSEFSKFCRDLVNERWTMAGNKKSLHHGVADCKENLDRLHSPAKRARQGYKVLGNALKNGFSDRQNPKNPLTLQQLDEQASKMGKHSYERRRPPSVPCQDDDVLFSRRTAMIQDVLQAKEFEKCENSKVLRMERESNLVNFGFNILGDLFTERTIVVRQVDRDSIAERAGLKQRDRITRINDIDCKRARKSDIVSLIKSENNLELTVVSSNHFKEAQDIHVNDRAVAMATGEVHDYDTKDVTIYTNEDGWMGCSIRGGTDYDCKVHIISIADGSPAETAGLKQGDIIHKVNGVSLNDCTHVQAVHLILKASPPITFTVKHDNRHECDFQRVLPEGQNDNLPHTPLRINSHKPRRLQQYASDMVRYQSPLLPPPPPQPEYWYQNDNPYQSPLPPPPPPPQLEYWYQNDNPYQSPLPQPPPQPEYRYQNDNINPSVGANGVVGSPSALPLSTLYLDGIPPPPYTAKLPQMHRVIQMGGNTMGNQSPVNHSLFLPMESNMPSQNNSSGMLKNTEELTTEQLRRTERDVGQQCTKGPDAAASRKNSTSYSLNIETSPIGNSHRVLPSKGIHDISCNPAGFNTDQDEADVKPNSRSCLLVAIRNFNPGLLKTIKEKSNSSTPDKYLLSSGVNDSLEPDAEPIRGNENSVSTAKFNKEIESTEADFRTIINQALMKRRADILDSSQESIDESYCEWDL